MKSAARSRYYSAAKNNPVLIGETGVGKTTIVEGLAHGVSSMAKCRIR